jgi:hypothetical protein
MTTFKYLNDENKYKVYENSNIFSVKTNKFLTPNYSKINNCMYISLVIYGKNKKMVLHTLIYTVFKSIIPKTHYISHIDNDSKNNDINNLILLSRNSNKIEISNTNYEWKEIPLYENRYLINKEGNVKSLLTDKLLEENISKKFNTYKSVKLIDKNGKRKGYLIHRLVYQTFNGKINRNMVIDHINKNKQDNRLENLRMITQTENVKNCEKIITNNNLIQTNENFINISTKYKSYNFSNYEINENGEIKNKHLKILKTTKKNGYLFCYLYDKLTNEKITISIHQLVATIFLSNPNNYTIVHHKDNDRENNNYKNLEWTTHKQNIIYTQGKKIGQYNSNDNLIKIFDSVNDAFRELNKIYGNNIRLVCEGKRKTAFGYKWKYVI